MLLKLPVGWSSALWTRFRPARAPLKSSTADTWCRWCSMRGHAEMTADKFRHQVVTSATVVEVISHTPQVRGLTLLVHDKAFHFYAGQWVDLMVPGTQLVGGYSMCSAPHQLQLLGTLQLAVKRSSWPPAVWVHDTCEVGSVVNLRAGGECFYSPRAGTVSRPLLLLAGGVGVNPLLSILRHHRHLLTEPHQPHLSADRSHPRASILYSAATDGDMLFKDYLGELSRSEDVSVQYFVTRQTTSHSTINGLHTRRMDQTDLERAIDWTCQTTSSSAPAASSSAPVTACSPVCYICGPPGFIDSTAEWLRRLGVPEGDVGYEKWS